MQWPPHSAIDDISVCNFSDLTPQEFQLLIEAACEKRFGCREMIFTEGEPLRQVTPVVSGFAGIQFAHWRSVCSRWSRASERFLAREVIEKAGATWVFYPLSASMVAVTGGGREPKQPRNSVVLSLHGLVTRVNVAH